MIRHFLIITLSVYLLSCFSKTVTKTDVTDWIYGRMIYVDSTEVGANALEYLYIQLYPRPNGYQFEWIKDRNGIFRLSGLEEQKQYKLKVFFSESDELLSTKYLSKEDRNVIVDIPKELETKVEEIKTDDSLKSGDGQARPRRP